jgi:hypothetical protein
VYRINKLIMCQIGGAKFLIFDQQEIHVSYSESNAYFFKRYLVTSDMRLYKGIII